MILVLLQRCHRKLGMTDGLVASGHQPMTKALEWMKVELPNIRILIPRETTII